MAAIRSTLPGERKRRSVWLCLPPYATRGTEGCAPATIPSAQKGSSMESILGVLALDVTNQFASTGPNEAVLHRPWRRISEFGRPALKAQPAEEGSCPKSLRISRSMDNEILRPVERHFLPGTAA